MFENRNIRDQIVDKLIIAGGFWSYDNQSVRNNITDNQMIEATLERLDIDDINLLFRLFSVRKIKKVWLKTMVIQGEYYYSLNRFLAWYYFNIRYPDRYLKSIVTRHISKLMA